MKRNMLKAILELFPQNSNSVNWCIKPSIYSWEPSDDWTCCDCAFVLFFETGFKMHFYFFFFIQIYSD